MKQKQLFQIIVAGLLLALLAPTKAFALYDGDTFYDASTEGIKMKFQVISTSDMTCRVYQYSVDIKTSGIVTIPSTTASGYSVTEIGKNAFDGRRYITSINIPNSVTSIGYAAFDGCTSLTSINIPNIVTTIGSSAFSGCTGLTSINIPNSVTSIGNYAFSGCTGLTSISISNSISNSVTGIGNYAFSGCTGLTSISISNSVTSIGGFAFKGCTSLTSIVVDSGNSKYDSRNNCNAIIETATNTLIQGCKTSAIPNSVTTIGEYAFSGCKGLTSIYIPNSVTSIGNDAFSNCTGLTSVHISDLAAWCGISFSYYSSNPLCYAKHLFLNGVEVKDELVIPNSVTTIRSYAFYGFTGITSVRIPSSVTEIWRDAFYGCTGLTAVHISDLAAWCGISFGYYASNPLSYAKHLFLNGVEVKDELVIPNSATTIGSYAFYGYTGITSVRIPSSVTHIGYRTFYGCTGLTSVIIPNNVKIIWDEAFDSKVKKYVSKDHISLFALLDVNDDWNNIYDVNTEEHLPIKEITPSTIKFVEIGDSVNSLSILVNGKEIDNSTREMTGLEPGEKISIEMKAYYDTDSYVGPIKKDFEGKKLTMKTLQPKVVSPGNVIVQATSNLSDAETNVGFEWRRTDWTDDFTSNSGTAYLYEGTMEGYIRNLYTEKLWKYRPYYESSSGNRYYGDWVGVDPTNTSYFEPTVHTYASVSVDGNTAAVRGYAMRGSDNITEQGFKYWGQTAASRKREASVPANATTVKSTGTVMEVTLAGLDYGTTYSYVAYVTTTEGETFYGEERQFTTGGDPTGIRDAHIEKQAPKPVAYYDLNGRRLNVLQPGIVIVRMSDGTSNKILVK